MQLLESRIDAAAAASCDDDAELMMLIMMCNVQNGERAV